MMQDLIAKKGFPLEVLPPRTEAEIMATWGEPREPVVSICCATFNHINYIEDAMRGLLAQVTTFPFEIIVRDDASTDGTSDIVRDYARSYPNIIRVVINQQNQFTKGVRPLHVWPSLASGEYIALCEEDDFWISPTKLQRQFELLERYPNAVMSVARTYFCQQDGEKLKYLNVTKADDNVLLGFEEIKKYYYHTSTYVIKSYILKDVITRFFSGHALFGDTALRAILISYGPFAFLPEIVSVYRQTGNGIWSSLDRKKQLKWEFEAARKLSGMLHGVHGEFQRQRLYGLLKELFRVHSKNGSIFEGINLVPLMFWFGLVKVPGYLRRRLKRQMEKQEGLTR
ncbi:MAG: glycosyltransferase [Geobacteraceae bacterium]|nr:glycosyltransferase [Geobacteraceae bacterium]